MSTTSTRRIPSTRVRPRADAVPHTCWCGADVDQDRARSCPRCGRSSRVGTPVVLSLPFV